MALVEQLRARGRIGIAAHFIAALRAHQRIWINVIDEPITCVQIINARDYNTPILEIAVRYQHPFPRK